MAGYKRAEDIIARPIPVLSWLIAVLLSGQSAAAAVSSGGKYTLEKSSMFPVLTAEIGASSITISLGEPFYPAGPERNFIKEDPYALYDGFLGRKFLLNHSLLQIERLVFSTGWITIPADAIPFDYEIYSYVNPQASSVISANSKMEINRGVFSGAFPKGIVQFSIGDENGVVQMESFRKPPILLINYIDANNDGIIDGINPPVRTKTLSLWNLDERKELWMKMSHAGRDSVLKNMSLAVNAPGIFGLFGTSDTNVDDVYAYPVPWRPNGGNPDFGTMSEGITFINLPSEGSIKIFNLAGELVRKIDIPAGLVPAKLRWDARNKAGENVVSGVYIWQVCSGRNTKSGKLMVIR
ncbi:MAG: hypothetical protein ABIG11_06775 [bacterium]